MQRPLRPGILMALCRCSLPLPEWGSIHAAKTLVCCIFSIANGLVLMQGKLPGTPRMRFQATSVPVGAVSGQKGGRAKQCCCFFPPVHSTCHLETPFCELSHTSLGCQDNGQQASIVTPHFLCTELSNHDRCWRCRWYQRFLYFPSAWLNHSPGRRCFWDAKRGQCCQSEALRACEMFCLTR